MKVGNQNFLVKTDALARIGASSFFGRGSAEKLLRIAGSASEKIKRLFYFASLRLLRDYFHAKAQRRKLAPKSMNQWPSSFEIVDYFLHRN
ncbi:hypothetical protein [Flavobacterium sp. 3HN19-14]|uniref:hypothetical protein n=1 Tax=Flavobacterium sp. 3HN19-14 TaxID=3448133 RepID=UPI003EE3B843